MNYQRLTTEKQVKDLIQWHNENLDMPLVLDCEATSTDPRKAELIDVQLSTNDHLCPAIFESRFVSHLLSLDDKKILIGHHYAYDGHLLLRSGVDLLHSSWRDTLILGHLLDENRDSYSLDSYVQEYWQDDYKERFWAQYKSYQEAPEHDRDEYATKDIIYTQKLYERQQEDLRIQGIPITLVDLVHELQRHLLNTQVKGIAVDLNYLTVKGVDLKTKINKLLPEMRGPAEIECQLWEMQEYEKELSKRKTDKGKAGVKQPSFSFDSAKQLQDLLYDKLLLPTQYNDKTKSVSTDEASLEKLKDSHPLIPKLLEYREHQKVFTAFIEGTRDKLDGGRVYPSFRVTGTATGRISHSNPNLAQLPKAGGIRGIYVPDPGKVLLSRDYSQLEVNIEANITGDPNTTRIFQEGLSKHEVTAQGLGISRDRAKTLNFAMGYHCTHFKVAKLLGVGLKEAEDIWHRYWDTYSGCRDTKTETNRMVDSGEHVVTLFGRRRRFPAIKRSPYDKAYRQAYNFLIQGTGADITSTAFVRISDKLKTAGWGRGLWTVHDECIVEVNEEFAEEADKFMAETMTAVGDEIGLKIPLKSEGSGPMERWLDG